MLTTFNEPYEKYSDYLRWSTPRDSLSQSAEESGIPRLSFLRVEMSRLRTGMNDFIIRVSTPKIASLPRSNTIISFRGNRSLAKPAGPKAFATVLVAEMDKRIDKTHKWKATDIDHLATLLGLIKVFAAQSQIDSMSFTTEALL